MKNRRHMMILDIVENAIVTTQEELVEELQKRGETVTQATISRDIKDLRLIKVTDNMGNHRYTTDVQPSQEISERQIRMFVDSVLSIQSAKNMIIIKTISGSASAAAETVDALQWSDILGSIAGDNTILIILRDDANTTAVVEKFKSFLR